MTDDAETVLEPSQQRMLAALSNGRHPRSIPRQSKLWELIQASTERLDRVAKGHSMVSYLPAVEEEDGDWPMIRQLSSPSTLESFPAAAASNEKSAVAKGVPAALEKLNVEFKHNLPLHFGMSVVITTTTDEVLVMTEDDQLVIKAVPEIEQSDQYTFHVINLLNPVDSRPVKFGDPIWIKVPSSRRKRWESIAIIAAKLESPPVLRYLKHTQHGAASRCCNVDGSDNSAANNPTVCGSPVPLPVTVQRSTDEADREERLNRQRHKHASEVGRWVVQCGTVDGQAATGTKILGGDVVYLEQNLYCIATSQGTTSTMSGTSHGFSPNTIARKHVRDREQLLRKTIKGETAGLPACLRSVMFREADQYEFRLDRRCLWHIRVIESQETLKSLPRGEVKAHKLLRLAKQKLRESEHNRAGGTIYPGASVDGRPLTSGANFARGMRQAMVNSAAQLEQQSVRAQTAADRIRRLNRCASANARLEGRRPSSAQADMHNPRVVLQTLDVDDSSDSELDACRICSMMHNQETKYHLCSIHRKTETLALKACDRTQIAEYPVTPPIHHQRRSPATSTLGRLESRSSDSLSTTGGGLERRKQKMGVAVPVYTAQDIFSKFQQEDDNLMKIMRYEARTTRAKRVLSLFDEYVPKPTVDNA